MCPELCKQSCGGYLEHKQIFGLAFYGISIVRIKFLHWYSGRVGLKRGKPSYKTKIKLNNSYGGSQKVGHPLLV